jgi:Flp pilus assembly protein TadB
MGAQYKLERVVIAALAALCLFAGLVLTAITASQSTAGDSLCIAAAIIGMLWVAYSRVRRQKQIKR